MMTVDRSAIKNIAYLTGLPKYGKEQKSLSIVTYAVACNNYDNSFTAFLVVVTMCYIAYYLTNAAMATNSEVGCTTAYLLLMTIQETFYTVSQKKTRH